LAAMWTPSERLVRDLTRVDCSPPTLVTVLFFFSGRAATEIYTLSLHDALPILAGPRGRSRGEWERADRLPRRRRRLHAAPQGHRSEEHTSELQSRENLVCRLLLVNKKQMEK